MSRKASRDTPVGAELERGLLTTLDFADETRFMMLDKAVARRVISSTTANGSRVAEGPGGRKKRGLKTLRSPARESTLRPPRHPQPL